MLRIHPFFRGLVLSAFLLFSCDAKPVAESDAENTTPDHPVAVAIPADTVDFSDPGISLVNGVYQLEGKPYSGTLYKELKEVGMTTFSSVLEGKLHGEYRSFYENGDLYEVRNYANNASLGKQYGYWKGSDVLKFEYNYDNDKKEGPQKTWYADGTPASHYNYRDDRQEGLQRAWRENGSLYRNFQVKDGTRYGLQRAKSCYELTDEQVK